MTNSANPVLRHEDRAVFDRLFESYVSEFKPTTTHEQFLVDQLAQSRWRLDRARHLEVLALHQIAGFMEPDETNPNSRILAHLGPNALTTLNRWAAASEKSYYRAHRELAQGRSREKRNKANEAQAWLKEQLEAIRTPPLDSWILYGAAPLQNEPNPDRAGASPDYAASQTTHPSAAPLQNKPNPGGPEASPGYAAPRTTHASAAPLQNEPNPAPANPPKPPRSRLSRRERRRQRAMGMA